MSQYMICGDFHGNTWWAMRMVDKAVELGIGTIIHLGDYGIWPGPSGDKYIRKVNNYASERNVQINFVDGNHEDFPKLYKFPIGESGLRDVASNIKHIPRGFTWESGGLRFMGLGGAVSIDRQHRVPGKSWWPEETLTEADMRKALDAGPIDVLFSHDCTTSIPMTWLKPDIESHMHRRRITKVVDTLHPRLHFHGHMHYPARYWHRSYEGHGIDTECISLDCDPQVQIVYNGLHNWCVFDLATRRVHFPTDPNAIAFNRTDEWYSERGW